MNLLDVIRSLQQGAQPQPNPGMGFEFPPGGGNGGGIVPTQEQQAASEVMARQFGVPSPQDVTYNEAPVQEPTPEILVQGGRQGGPPSAPVLDHSRYAMPDEVPNLSNTQMVEEALAVQRQNDKLHKGRFGESGTLRKIMGTLGDAFLVQGGAERRYAPQVERERKSDAMQGFTINPYAAMERMVQADPGAAHELQKSYATQENARQVAEANAAKERAARYAQGIKAFGGYMGAANPETYSKLVPALKQIKETYGLGDEFQVPDQFDPDYAAAVSDGSIERYKQQTLGQGERRLDQGDARIEETGRHNKVNENLSAGRLAVAQRNAETARLRMEKSGSAGRAQSRTEYFDSLQQIPASQRTPDQQAWIDNEVGRNRGGGRSSRSGGASSDRSSRFKRLN